MLKRWHKNAIVTWILLLSAFCLGTPEQICKGDARHVAIMQSSYQDKYDQLVWREFLLSWKWWRTSDISLTHLFYLLKPRLKLQLHKLKIIHFHTSNCDSVFRTLNAVYEVVGEPTDRDKAEQLFKKLDENCDGEISKEEFINIIKQDHKLLNILEKIAETLIWLEK